MFLKKGEVGYVLHDHDDGSEDIYYFMIKEGYFFGDIDIIFNNDFR